MSTPRKVRAKKKFMVVMEELFEAFPELLWFRNVHDGALRIDPTAGYMAVWSRQNDTFQMEYLTIGLDGPVIYYGRDIKGRLWMFASNSLINPYPNQIGLMSVERPDHFMVAVFNTIVNRHGLLPLEKSSLFLSSMSLSNCEEPAHEVIEWLQKHQGEMPERLSEACDCACLYRM
jgi:hypothetical protein